MNFIKRRTFSTVNSKLSSICKATLEEIQSAGTYKKERPISSAQAVEIEVNGKRLLNFCANNYLGFSNSKELIEAAKNGLENRGFGMSSVRFICGTQDIHKNLEKSISEFHNKEDAILYSSCFDANAGIFEALLGENDAVISDSLNHASIIDGIRLCKAKRFRYNHLDMKDLEEKLREAEGARIKLIATDGVFSMDGDIAPLDKICNLASKYGANIFLDESHATGFIGKTGRGTPELFGVNDHIDIICSTLGKALGGSSGGYTTGKKEVIDVLRQKSRPYLFSNSLAPNIVSASLKAFEILSRSSNLPEKLLKNTTLFRTEMKRIGFKILGHEKCPIVPVYLSDEKLATEFGNEMVENGIYVVGFCYPVVPKGHARIRVQLSAAHSEENIIEAVKIFEKIGKAKKIIANSKF